MANDISKLYQFLGTLGDWKTKMDKNEDGTIIKAEFREFMNNSDFEWDGTPTDSDKNSIIDQFWAKFDTNRTNAKISGSKYRNKNALDNNEINTMQETIGIYENLNTYTSKLTAPTGVDAAAWKKSVSESLATLTETFIKEGGKADDLAAYLDEQIEKVEARTTADQYAVATAKEYKSQLNNYDLYSDSTFKSFLDTYIEAKINNASEADGVPSAEDVKAEIKEIAQAYVATSKGEASDVLEAEPYNYKQEDSSALNGLQIAKIKNEVAPTLEAAVKTEANYEAYKDAFDAALSSYLEEEIGKLNYSNFDEFLEKGTIPSLTMETFKSSEAYKTVTNTITINQTIDNISADSELYTNLKETYGEDFANRIMNDGKYITAMQDIKNAAIEKMKNGEYNTNGAFDSEKLVADLVKQLGSNIQSFYSNGLGDLELDDLNTVYGSFVKAASQETDSQAELQKRRDAAIMYCDALYSKSAYKSAVTDVFGEDYKKAINNMLPSEIETKITDIQEKAAEIVDTSKVKLVDSSWGDLKDNINIAVGKTKTYSLNPVFTDESGKSVTITSDHIEYKSSNTSVASVDSTGKITVNGAKGTYQTTITIIVNEKEIGSKTITVKGDESVDFKDLTDVKYDDNTTISSLLATGSKTLRVADFSKSSYKNDSINGITNAINDLAAKLKASGHFDSEKLDKVTKTLINYYTAAISAIDFNTDAGSGKRSDGYINTTFTYKDAEGNSITETTKYQKRTVKKEKNSQGYTDAANIDHNSLGLSIQESFKGTDTYNCTLNIAVLIEKFATFYNAM